MRECAAHPENATKPYSREPTIVGLPLVSLYLLYTRLIPSNTAIADAQGMAAPSRKYLAKQLALTR